MRPTTTACGGPRGASTPCTGCYSATSPSPLVQNPDSGCYIGCYKVLHRVLQFRIFPIQWAKLRVKRREQLTKNRRGAAKFGPRWTRQVPRVTFLPSASLQSTRLIVSTSSPDEETPLESDWQAINNRCATGNRSTPVMEA
jgi:hypothetical protein